MTRDGFVQRLVLDVICDDYENVDQTILRDVAKGGAECGLAIGRTEVVNAIASLVAQGLAKGYILSCREPRCMELDSMPAIDVAEEYFETYFLATAKGIDLQLSDDSWWPWQEG